MTNIMNLYHEEILTFARQLRDAAPLASPNATATLVNPTCGDQVMVELEISDFKIKAISAKVKGCAICEASTGFALGALEGMTIEEAKDIPLQISNFLEAGGDMPLDNGQAFEAIKDFKSRHSCIRLVYDATLKAIMTKE